MTETKPFYQKFKQTLLNHRELPTEILKRRFQVSSDQNKETEEVSISLPTFFVFPQSFTFDSLSQSTILTEAHSVEEALHRGVQELVLHKQVATRLFEDYLYTYDLNCTFIDQFIQTEEGTFIDVPNVTWNSAEHGLIHQRLNRYFKGEPKFVEEIEHSLFDETWKPPYSEELKSYILAHDERFLNLVKTNYHVLPIEKNDQKVFLVSEKTTLTAGAFKVLYLEDESTLFQTYYETFYDFNNKKSFPFIYDFYANTGLGRYLYEDQKGICFDVETGELRNDLKICLKTPEAIEDYLIKNLKENMTLFFEGHEDYCQICLNYALASDETKEAIIFPKEMIRFILNRCNELDMAFTLHSIPLT